MANSVWKRSALLVVATCVVGCQLSPQPATSQSGAPNAGKLNPVQFVRRTGDSVADALRIEPRVVKSLDPTSLQYDPGPIKPELHLSAAAVMAQSGQFDGAREHYLEVLKIDPANRAALVGLARLYHSQGAMDEAIGAYRHAIEVVGNDPVVLNDLALCLARVNRYDEAADNLRRALALKPDSLLYRNNLSAVLVQAQRIDDAVAVLAETHGAAIAHYNVGYMLNQNGQPAAASAHFVHALRADPRFEPARTMLDRVLPDVGRGPEERVAERPEPSASAAAAVPPATATAGTVTSPAVERASDGLLTSGPPAEPNSTEVQPAGFAEPVSSISVEAAPDLDPLPPIRLPIPGSTRRPQIGPGGFVAPTPANP